MKVILSISDFSLSFKGVSVSLNISEDEKHIIIFKSFTLGSIFLYFSGWNGQQTCSDRIGFKSCIHLLQRLACEEIS